MIYPILQITKISPFSQTTVLTSFEHSRLAWKRLGSHAFFACHRNRSAFHQLIKAKPLPAKQRERILRERGKGSILLWAESIEYYVRCPRPSSFWVPRNLSHHMIRQARTGHTVLVKRREMTGRTPTLPWWLRGEGVKNRKTTENKIHLPPVAVLHPQRATLT